MIRAHGRDTLAAEERQTLLESARVCEMILETNSADTGALETLKEIYTKLGDRDRLMQVLSALAVFSGVSASVGVAASKADELDELPAEPDPGPGHLPGPLPSGASRASAIGSSPKGSVTPEQLAQALTAQKGTRDKLGTALVRLGVLAEESLLDCLSRQHNVPPVTLTPARRHRSGRAAAGSRPPRREARGAADQALPGIHSPWPWRIPPTCWALDDVAFMTNLQIQSPSSPPRSAIRQAIDRLYNSGESVADMMTELEEADGDVQIIEGAEEVAGKAADVFELKESADEAPVVRLMSMILVDAIRRGASDIHLEPYEKVFRVRFRVDGVLHEIMAPPKRLEAALTSRVKIMANLDIAERRLPAGRPHQAADTTTARSTSASPRCRPIFGEKSVMRILDKEALQLDMTKLGFEAWSLEQFNKAIRQPPRDDPHHADRRAPARRRRCTRRSTRSTRRRSTS